MATAATKVRRWTAREVNTALFHHFTGQGYAPLTEVTAAPERHWLDLHVQDGLPLGEAREQGIARRIDMLLLRKARKEGIGEVERLAVEVKVTRGDFLADVRNPDKQAVWRGLAHRHAYATPEGLVTADEVPDGSGLLTVAQWGVSSFSRVEWTKRAPYGEPPPELPAWMVTSFAARAAWAEARVKGLLLRQDGDDDPDVLRAEVERLRVDNERLGKRLDREIDKASAWRAAYGATSGLPCRTCGRPVLPLSPRGGMFTSWRHRDKADDGPCEGKRAALSESNAKVAAGRARDGEFDRQLAARHGCEVWQLAHYLHPVEVAPADDGGDGED